MLRLRGVFFLPLPWDREDVVVEVVIFLGLVSPPGPATNKRMNDNDWSGLAWEGSIIVTQHVHPGR